MNKISSQPTSRRAVLKIGSALLLSAAPLAAALADVLSELGPNAMVTIENFTPDGISRGVLRVARVVQSDAGWAGKLSPESFRVTRQGEADHPFTGSLWNSHADGIYQCICCDTALFDSRHKFESGTGWPSFWQPISALNIGVQNDAISCSRCDAHLGHVFRDGPEPTGLRYSASTLALQFAASS